MRGKRQLQFHFVQFDQRGNVLSSKRPRFGSNELDKRDGKGKKIQSQQHFATEATQLTYKCNLKHIVLLLRDQQRPTYQFSSLLFLVNTLRTVLKTFAKN